jgi:hypothetical protein
VAPQAVPHTRRARWAFPARGLSSGTAQPWPPPPARRRPPRDLFLVGQWATAPCDLLLWGCGCTPLPHLSVKHLTLRLVHLQALDRSPTTYSLFFPRSLYTLGKAYACKARSECDSVWASAPGIGQPGSASKPLWHREETLKTIHGYAT